MRDIAAAGRICILDIEMEGVKQVQQTSDLQARFLFLAPPSVRVLEERLRKRGTETEASLEKRLMQAKVEMEFAASEHSPHEKVVVNDELERAFGEVEAWVVDGGRYGSREGEA